MLLAIASARENGEARILRKVGVAERQVTEDKDGPSRRFDLAAVLACAAKASVLNPLVGF